MKYLLPFLLLLTFVFSAYSQAVAPATDAISEFDVNGMKVIFKRRPSSPTVATGLFFRGGTRNETTANAGIENFVLDAATEGSKKYPKDALRKELARTGTAIDAAAAYDYSAVSMISTSENFAKSWDILADLVMNPTFTPDDVERTRNAVLAGLRNASASPDSALDDLESKVIYAGHPYAADPNGTIETVSKFTPEALRAYHKNLIQTSRMLLVVVGDTNADDIKRLVTASFGSLPRGTYKDTPMPRLQFSSPSLDITSRTLNTNYVKGVFQAPSITDPDYYAMRVAISILQRKVYEVVRLQLNLSYAPNATMNDRAANSAEIYVTSTDANQAVKVMLNEIDKMRQAPIDQEEFVGVPGYFLTTYYVDQETNAAQVGELAKYELIGGGWHNSLNFLNGIASVTPEDVYKASAKYMKNIRFVVIGSPSAIDRSVFVGSAH